VEPLYHIVGILEAANDTVRSSAFAGFRRSLALFQRSRESQEEQHQNDFGLISASALRAHRRQR
jgi:hypothetical protein